MRPDELPFLSASFKTYFEGKFVQTYNASSYGREKAIEDIGYFKLTG